MDKPRLHTSYYFIDLLDDWNDFNYRQRENVMDQTDRYNIATKNWSYDLADLEARTYDILHLLTCKEDAEIAAIMIRQEERSGAHEKTE